jgi:hypothetical protein
MSYELLTGNKPNVSYFRVLGSKCYILVKKGRNSKFAPKAIEGFLLGYDSNTKAYKVFNKLSGLVEVSSNVVFDETNGSPREQVDLDDVDEDVVPTDAIRTMTIGDVRPQEHQVQDQPSSSTMVHPITQDDEQVPQEEACDQGGAQEDQVEEEEVPRAPPTQARAMIQRNHPIDQILGDISKGVMKRPNPLGLKCDTITSPRRLVNTFIQQMIPDLLKRDKPIKVAINFKSWSTTRDISSEWG